MDICERSFGAVAPVPTPEVTATLTPGPTPTYGVGGSGKVGTVSISTQSPTPVTAGSSATCIITVTRNKPGVFDATLSIASLFIVTATNNADQTDFATGSGTLNVQAPSCTSPSISVHPSSATKVVGESVTFSVTASGTGLSLMVFSMCTRAKAIQ